MGGAAGDGPDVWFHGAFLGRKLTAPRYAAIMYKPNEFLLWQP